MPSLRRSARQQPSLAPRRSPLPEQTVMLWLGHRDSKMIRRYYHLNDDEAQRQMSKLKSVGGAGAA